jgi:predicted dehydrogenase
MTREPLRLGIVGVGALALRGLLPHLTQDDVSDRVRVEAVCDPVAQRAEGAAERFGVPRWYRSLEELLEACDVDAVSIASPIGLHFEHGLLALEAGKHAHFNKTLATTVAEADELIRTAAERDVRIVASPGEILRPQLQRTRQLIESGAIGTLAWAICGGAFESYHEQDEPERFDAPGGAPIDPSWYFRKPGGGPMYDISVYALHGLTGVLGPARRVTAVSSIRIPEREFMGRAVPIDADDNTMLLVDFGDGLVAVVHGTAAGAISEQFGAAVYFGTAGTIDGIVMNGEPFEFPGRELTVDAPPADWDAQMRVLPHVTGPHRDIQEAHVFEDVMQLVDWVLDGTPTPVTAEHARHVIDIIESGYRAAETGVTQELRTTFDRSPLSPAMATVDG